ncbi:hypothetical protein CEXT_295061 [Caerostris extrusa]|uniref:Uncharacterized protein n=1 Tax=Caerostris extrusa TaxID=172846 RepID=A0AAV4RUV3_CAEEX|nr:hypothetical protein CEXT_295061 [Caerostris extrusa]
MPSGSKCEPPPNFGVTIQVQGIIAVVAESTVPVPTLQNLEIKMGHARNDLPMQFDDLVYMKKGTTFLEPTQRRFWYLLRGKRPRSSDMLSQLTRKKLRLPIQQFEAWGGTLVGAEWLPDLGSEFRFLTLRVLLWRKTENSPTLPIT